MHGAMNRPVDDPRRDRCGARRLGRYRCRRLLRRGARCRRIGRRRRSRLFGARRARIGGIGALLCIGRLILRDRGLIARAGDLRLRGHRGIRLRRGIALAPLALRHADRVIAAMPERMRLAYRLFRIDQVPQREIATRLDISVSAVEKLLQRAYRRLHALADGGDDD